MTCRFQRNTQNYPLYTFSALASTFFIYRATQGQRLREWIFYAAALAFSFYSFYPSLFVLVAQLCWFFGCYGRRRDLIKRLLLSLGLALMVMGPMLASAVNAFRYKANFGNGLWGLQSYAQISQAILEHFGGMTGSLSWGIIVFALGFVGVFYFQKRRSQASLLLLLVVVPIFLYTACFYIFRISIVARLFSPVYPFFLLMAAAGIVSWKHWAARAVGIFTFVLPLFFCALCVNGIVGHDFLPDDYGRQRADFSGVASVIEKQYSDTPLDYVAVVPWSLLFFIQYDLDNGKNLPIVRNFKNSGTVKYLRNSSKELYTVYTNPKITIYGVDGYLSMLKDLAAAGRLLVVDVVSGNLAKLPGGAETVSWLRASAYRTEHKEGADFYFILPPANASTDYRKSSEIVRQKLFLESRIAGQTNSWGKGGADD